MYINSQGRNLNAGVVERIGRWAGKMLRMLGLGEGGSRNAESEIGWGEEREQGTVNVRQSNNEIIGWHSLDIMLMFYPLPFQLQRDEVLMPYLRVLSSFRDGVRRIAIDGGEDALRNILKLSDQLRDVDLVPLGVALDDQEGTAASTWRLFDRITGARSSLISYSCL